jgi:ATP/maltotriose-dependent transcriptional regulator MalT
MLEAAQEGSQDVLSVRELEILLLAARGLSNRQIGASLHVTEGTVKRHLANTYEKMRVSSRGQATRKALFEEWITIQDITDDLDEP